MDYDGAPNDKSFRCNHLKSAMIRRSRLDVDRSPPIALRLFVEPACYQINLSSWPLLPPRKENDFVSRLAAPVPGSVQRDREPFTEGLGR
jgi:hypothetical protein